MENELEQLAWQRELDEAQQRELLAFTAAQLERHADALGNLNAFEMLANPDLGCERGEPDQPELQQCAPAPSRAQAMPLSPVPSPRQRPPAPPAHHTNAVEPVLVPQHVPGAPHQHHHHQYQHQQQYQPPDPPFSPQVFPHPSYFQQQPPQPPQPPQLEQLALFLGLSAGHTPSSAGPAWLPSPSPSPSPSPLFDAPNQHHQQQPSYQNQFQFQDQCYQQQQVQQPQHSQPPLQQPPSCSPASPPPTSLGARPCAAVPPVPSRRAAGSPEWALQVDGLPRDVWYTRRNFPPFTVSVLNLATNRLECHVDDWEVGLQLFDRFDNDVTHFLSSHSPCLSRGFPIRQGRVVITGLRCSNVSSKHGGSFRLVVYACSVGQGASPSRVKPFKSPPLQVLSYRLFHSPKLSVERLGPHDSIARMRGIGIQYSQRLEKLGIGRVHELAALDVDALDEADRKRLLAALRKDRGALTLPKLRDYVAQANAIIEQSRR